MLERWFNEAWYGGGRWTYCLLPLAWLYGWIIRRKRQQFLDSDDKSPLPTIVVGNITVGGTGKTPIVQALVRFLKSQGYRPGVISRGYGGECDLFPHLISMSDSVSWTGDEPYMLAHSLSVPVVIDPVRTRGIALLQDQNVDVVISDDGMQHYNMPRDIEICVIDGQRGLGNQALMPVGPLREPVSRIDGVDFVLSSGPLLEANYEFSFRPRAWVNVKNGQQVPVGGMTFDARCSAIAGIGNPQKFFDTLSALDIQFDAHAYPDHHDYTKADLASLNTCILMTEKDAVKIKPFATESMWALSIDAYLDSVFYTELMNKLALVRDDDG